MFNLGKLSSIVATLAVATISILASSGAASAATIGTEWQNGGYSSNPATKGMTSVAYGNGVFVGLNGSGIFRSTDGKSWSSVSVAFSPTGGWVAVAFGSNKFMILADDNGHTEPFTSVDGISFHQEQTLFMSDPQFITFGAGKFVITNCSDGEAGFSSNLGMSWTVSSTDSGDCSRGVSFGNSTYVSVTDSGAIDFSPDAENWTEVNFTTPPPNSRSFSQVTFNGSIFLALYNDGSDEYVYSSSDGETWASSSSAGISGSEGWGIGFDGTAWLAGAGGAETGIYRSVDNGANWTQVNSNNTQWPAFALGNGIVVAGGVPQVSAGTSGLDGALAVGWSVGDPAPNPPAPTPNTLAETGMDVSWMQYTSAIASFMLAIGVLSLYAARRRNH